MNVVPVDDSLLLVLGFPDPRTHALITLRRLDGSVKSRFFDRHGYFTPEQPALIQNSYVVADASNGIVLAGLRGDDSLFAFDYDGRPIASGKLHLDRGPSLPTYRRLIEDNGGRLRRPDSSAVIDGEPALVALAVTRDHRAVLQIMRLTLSRRGFTDLSEGGSFVLAHVAPPSVALAPEPGLQLEMGLIGRDQAGGILLFKYLGRQYDAVEISRLNLIASHERTDR